MERITTTSVQCTLTRRHSLRRLETATNRPSGRCWRVEGLAALVASTHSLPLISHVSNQSISEDKFVLVTGPTGQLGLLVQSPATQAPRPALEYASSLTADTPALEATTSSPGVTSTPVSEKVRCIL